MLQLCDPLESRRLMSTSLPSPTAPTSFTTVSEPVYEFAGLAQQDRIAYLPKLAVTQLAQLHGTLDWGDKTTSAASFDRNKNGGIDVIATHTYIKPGTFAISTVLTLTPANYPGHPTPQYIILLGEVDTTATVTIAPPQITQTVNQPFTATLGKFIDKTAGVSLTAQINWGDGHVITDGVVTNAGLFNGNFEITGSHTYAYVGTYLVHASVYSHQPGSKSPGVLIETFEVLMHVEKSPVL